MDLAFRAPFADQVTAAQSSCGTIAVEESISDDIGGVDIDDNLVLLGGGALVLLLIIVALLVI